MPAAISAIKIPETTTLSTTTKSETAEVLCIRNSMQDSLHRNGNWNCDIPQLTNTKKRGPADQIWQLKLVGAVRPDASWLLSKHVFCLRLSQILNSARNNGRTLSDVRLNMPFV